MIRVELGHNAARGGKWRWSVREYAVEGFSRQPLLDACREIKRVGGDTAARAGLFWPGRDQPSMTCVVGVGAGLTVEEGRTSFAKWKEYPDAIQR